MLSNFSLVIIIMLQAKLRSTIRIQDGRAKAIDLLAKYISTEEVDQQLAVEMHDPQKFIEGKINITYIVRLI